MLGLKLRRIEISQSKIDIQYFSDVLCIWAYVAQARLDELQTQYQDKLQVTYHYVSIYGNTQKRIFENWKKRGGVAAYKHYVEGVANDFGHVQVSDKFWQHAIGPKSSASIHLFLKSVANLIELSEIDNQPQPQFNGKTLYEELIWQCRHQYFGKGFNVGLLKNQLQIANELSLPTGAIKEGIENGSAFAALCEDNELKEKYKIEGSPTYILNEGRQKLYGNVGYKIIAANIEELLNRPEGVASWC